MKRKLIICSLILISFVTYFIVSYDNKEVMQVSNLDNNLNDIAFYIQKEEGSEEYNSVDTIPSKDDGYIFKEAVCNDNSEVSFNNYLWRLEVSNMEQGKVRCKLYFDIDDAIARKYILSLNIVNESTPDFSKTATTDEGIFTAEDDYGTSYYWRGAVTNNYFYFAGYYWRIVRINGDGTLRLIYQGISPTSTEEESQISNTAWTSKENDNAYVGYMYGASGSNTYEETHANTNNSTMKNKLDEWYNDNLIDDEEYIADSGFCGDRSLTSGTGIGTTTTYYGAYGRLANNKTPSFKCMNQNDLYTKNNEQGNGALTNPIGLITADEVAYAGGVSTGTGGTSNTSYYLYNGQNYKVMTPYAYFNDSGTTRATLFGVDTNGVIRRFSNTTSSHGVRPVININKNVELEGTGTSRDPFKIVGTKIDTAANLLANYPTQLTRTDFSTTVTNTTTGTIYYEDTSKGRTYYFAGNPTDNWVYFGGFYWRIIRINEDGTIRMIYQGTSANTTGTGTQIGTSTFNSTSGDNMYVGYMYQSNQVHGLQESSTIKGVLDQWYQNNLTSVADKIDGNAGFCGDRQPSTSQSASNGSGGTGTTITYYGSYIRLFGNNKVPTFKCQNSSDLYTTPGSINGNQALTYPIGLISADEVAYAGGVWDTINRDFYLYTDNMYWTITPHDYTVAYKANMFAIDSSGCLYYGFGVNDTHGVRPVINLKSDVTIPSGTGTSTNPYIIA